DADALAAVAKEYRVYYKKVPLDGGDYTMDHTAIVYLMDKDGRFVSPFSLKRKPDAAAAELRKYLGQVSVKLTGGPRRGGATRPKVRGEVAMLQKRAQKIDKVIGRNVRIHRLARKMSQTELGEQLGVSFQQVQKYENGTNRVGSGRLYQIAAILGVHVSTFFK